MVVISEQTKSTLDAILSQAVAEGKVPGASLVVGSADKRLYFGASGVKSFGDPSAGKIDEDSIFWVCSHTKFIVTIAILQLIEEGKLSYDTPAENIIPELADPVVLDDIMAPTDGGSTYKPAQNKILVKHLLNHSSGLVYSMVGKKSPDDLNPAYTSEAYTNGQYTRNEFFRIIRRGYPSLPLAFEPGTDWGYSYGCDVIVFIVEELTGKSMQEYCQERIFDPIGVQPTFFINPLKRDDLVQLAYRSRKDGSFEKWADQLGTPERELDHMGIVLGGIALHCTLNDYLEMLQHILKIKAGIAKNPILSSETVNLIFKPSVPPHSTNNLFNFTGLLELYTQRLELSFGYGVALANEDWPDRKKKGSGFWYGWAGTFYFLDPSTGIAAVFGTQVVPTCDLEVSKLWERLEKALYAGLEV